jgi:hypothetical protein
LSDRIFILTVFLSGAMATDLKKGKIYNFWIAAAWAAGITGGIAAGIFGTAVPVLRDTGWGCLWNDRTALRLIVSMLLLPFPVLLLLLPVWQTGGLGAGDIKFLAVLSIFFSYPEFIRCCAAAFLLAAIPALVTLLRTKQLKSHIHFAVPAACAFLLHIGGLIP